MRRVYLLGLGAVVAALFCSQIETSTGVESGLGLAALALFGLLTRLTTYRRYAAIPLILIAAGFIASAVAAGWGIASILSGAAAILLVLAAVLLWQAHMTTAGRGELTPVGNRDTWSAFSAGDDPTDDPEQVT